MALIGVSPLAGTLAPIHAPLSKTVSSIGTSISKFFSSRQAGAKLAKLGIGLGVAGAGIGIGASVATEGVTSAGKKTSDVFGMPIEIVFIIGVVLLVLVLVMFGGKR